ncbi:unnamed protein product [Parascedosporium putredinis]|uniref:Uncharacterized protein n=1 Tax=Parascedosporium putredinis TaxID=1442378 RepID=A0A9P1M8F8_9PEZI|nr:unnamed protein product [Parascedosporium putredinis]CAI7990059.1 unnamed protein product [Parascedosporium putredinis]
MLLPRISSPLLPRQEASPPTNQQPTLIRTGTLSLPVIIVIAVLAVAAFFIAVLTTYCVLTKRWATKRHDLEPPLPPANSDAVAAAKEPSLRLKSKARRARKLRTLVFQQHEPGEHGYFAPLYLPDEHPARESRRRMDADRLADVKRYVLEVYDPAVLDREEIKPPAGAKLRSFREKETRP